MLKVYVYRGCSTCRSALNWLEAAGVAHQEVAIRETPPSVVELKAMMKARGGLRPLFNSSGLDYRALDLKTKLPAMSADEALALLSSNGNLVKRPFAIDTKAGVFLTGFREEEWAATLA